jgi:hypothetical protein
MSWNKGNNCNNMHGATIKKLVTTIQHQQEMNEMNYRALV